MPQTFQDRKPEAAAPKGGAIVQKRAKPDLAGQSFAAQEAALKPVQMKGNGKESPADVQATAAEGVKGGGSQLPHMDRIQASFGGAADVSGIRAHVGGEAKGAAQAIGASAYATGSDVAFQGTPDLHTAAHEAAHVVQQRAGVSLKGGVGAEGDSYEQHADAVADRVVQGKSAEDLLAQGGQTAGGAVQKKAVQRDTAPAAKGELTAAQATAAVTFNKGKALKAAAVTQIAGVVGSSSTVIDTTFVKAVALWQAKVGLTADGKIGDVTMGWLAQEPGGKGLEDLVKSDNLLYVGMNPQSKNLEHNKLKGQGANVTAVKGHKKQDNITVGTKDQDLNTAEGRKAFVDSLVGGLDPSRRDKLAAYIERSDFGSKDEIGELARALHKAETGQTIFTRVVLSGHSGGWSFWGDDNGDISFSDLKVIREIFPKATGCVQDLCMSACNTGQRQKLEQYRAIFPNVKSIWAYVGYSPSAATGALRHVGNWEMASRGAMDEGKLDAARIKTGQGGGDKDKHVATWTAKDGKETYKTDSEEAKYDFATVKADVDGQMPVYDKAMTQGIIDKQALSTLYTKLQTLVGNFSNRLPNAAEYDKKMKQILYLRYWENVTKKFEAQFGSQVKAGYEANRVQVPKFDGMSRDKALTTIAGYPKAGDATHKLLTSYLRDLDPTLIPPNWA